MFLITGNLALGVGNTTGTMQSYRRSGPVGLAQSFCASPNSVNGTIERDLNLETFDVCLSLYKDNEECIKCRKVEFCSKSLNSSGAM